MKDDEVARTAARAGMAAVRAHIGAPLTHFSKGDLDFATEADLAAESAIRAVIEAERPDDAFVGEESGGDRADVSGRTWLVDPLCGTLNFAFGLPLAAVNVALRSPQGGVAAVADPFAQELFWTDGDGAWLSVGDTTEALRPDAGSVLVDVWAHPASWAARVVAHPVFDAHFRHRSLSTTLGLTWVAAGRMAAYVEQGDVRDSVHFAAGIAVCRGAGAVVTALDGSPLHESGDGILAAADAETHEHLLRVVADAGR